MPLSDGFIFRNLKIVALITIWLRCGDSFSQTGILDSLFTFNSGPVKTGNALEIITRQTGYGFTYDSRLINTENRTELNFRNEKLGSVLRKVINNDSVTFSVINKYIIISRTILPGNEVLTKEPSKPAQVNYISGTVTDLETKDPLPYAALGLKNSGKGTVTNISGEFRLNIPDNSLTDTLSVTYLGFIPREIPVEQALGNNFNITLERDFISIPDIIIKTQSPRDVINKSIASVNKNYGMTPAMLTAFYREGVMKKSELQSYSEAVLQIYKSAYGGTLLNDQVKILKSRKIENTDARDTLAIRLKAGLSTCLELDGIKNTFDFLARQTMDDYTYRITDIVTVDEESAFVIDFEQKEAVEMPLFRGSVYINTVDFAVLQAEFELHPKYINRMKESFVTSSARGFTTWPLSVKYLVSYRKVNDRYVLNHVRGDLIFTSKQKKKLFNSQFNVFFELAVTGIDMVRVSRFEKDEIAPIHSVFSRTINKYDPDFWENQDFLKPEENLLQALKNMKVKLQEFSEPEN